MDKPLPDQCRVVLGFVAQQRLSADERLLSRLGLDRAGCGRIASGVEARPMVACCHDGLGTLPSHTKVLLLHPSGECEPASDSKRVGLLTTRRGVLQAGQDPQWDEVGADTVAFCVPTLAGPIYRLSARRQSSSRVVNVVAAKIFGVFVFGAVSVRMLAGWGEDAELVDFPCKVSEVPATLATGRRTRPPRLFKTVQPTIAYKVLGCLSKACLSREAGTYVHGCLCGCFPSSWPWEATCRACGTGLVPGAPKFCGGKCLGDALYCSRKCQIVDWPRHKKECS